MLFKFVVPLVVALLSLFGGAVWLLDVNPLPQQAERGAAQKEAAAEESAAKSSSQSPSNDLDALKEALAPADATSAGAAPAFDIARIDPDGASVFAGTGEPLSRVTITADGEEIGTADVDENGEWALTIDKRIANPDAKLALFKASRGEADQATESDRAAAAGEVGKHGGPQSREDANATAEAGEGSQRLPASAAPRTPPSSPPNIAGGGMSEVAQAEGGTTARGEAADATTPSAGADADAAAASGAAAAVQADQMKNLEGMVAEARAEAAAQAAATAAEANTESATAKAEPAQIDGGQAGNALAAGAEPATDGAAGTVEQEAARSGLGQAVTNAEAVAETGHSTASGNADAAAVATANAGAGALAGTAPNGSGTVSADGDANGGVTAQGASAAHASADIGQSAANALAAPDRGSVASGSPAASVTPAQEPEAALTIPAADKPAVATATALPPAATLASQPPQSAATTSELSPAAEIAATDTAPAATVSEAGANVAATSLSVPVPVTFVYNQATLTAEGRRAAGLLLEYLQIKRFPKVTLTGHADERGSHELNMRLSRERLEAVATFLREGGYDGPLELVPKGKTEPYMGVVRGDFAQDDLWQLDRRVELVISR